MPEADERCACGKPLHVRDPVSAAQVRRLVAELRSSVARGAARVPEPRRARQLGPTVSVTIPGVGSCRVPRYWIALHGLKAQELPALAARYGWAREEA
jgi:hypothetical protein